MQTIVVSATNLFLGGPLTVGREFVAALRASEAFERGDVRAIVLCHRRELYAGIPPHPNLELLELPHVRRNWLVRLYYEYIGFARWSRTRDIDLWISLQDLTPNVHARRRAVYCHNPAPFYAEKRRWLLDPRFEIFRLVYGFFYRINLAKNDWVIVQQQWMRSEMERRYGRPVSRTIVAHPVTPHPASGEGRMRGGHEDILRILYPVYPRSAKNHEVLIDAMREIRDLPIELTLTFTGDESRYARMIRERARGLARVHFAGFLSASELAREYERTDALVFPSKLETWGLPLSEFRPFGRPIFAAALQYAQEALGGYDRSVFFDPDSPASLARLLRDFATGKPLRYVTPPQHPPQPFAADWSELLQMLDVRGTSESPF